MARISTSAAKAKGRALQQKVRDKILELHPELEADDVVSCPMGSNGNDVQLSPAARKLFEYAVEAKSRKSVGLIYDAYEQAKAGDKHGLEPLVVIKADRKRPLAVVDLDHFFELLQKIHDK
jgi:hypothetical protein